MRSVLLALAFLLATANTTQASPAAAPESRVVKNGDRSWRSFLWTSAMYARGLGVGLEGLLARHNGADPARRPPKGKRMELPLLHEVLNRRGVTARHPNEVAAMVIAREFAMDRLSSQCSAHDAWTHADDRAWSRIRTALALSQGSLKKENPRASRALARLLESMPISKAPCKSFEVVQANTGRALEALWIAADRSR